MLPPPARTALSLLAKRIAALVYRDRRPLARGVYNAAKNNVTSRISTAPRLHVRQTQMTLSQTQMYFSSYLGTVHMLGRFLVETPCRASNRVEDT